MSRARQMGMKNKEKRKKLIMMCQDKPLPKEDVDWGIVHISTVIFYVN